ncbi:uncharacterized protein LOC125041914 [Penaeus chinensis]|uniref:uncharacterized protein LOC125041914 n=1 Tax=Penaeus chinensis TaxID=139456 RepID=UPI001FB56E52|nr:uncharacterized protein LOC125041914 [Penaeus chinensis]XP_047493266.1 uncharacterized protein LOC125041914 [Penaeus chinensis]
MAGRRMTYAIFALTLLCAGLGEETECPSQENSYAVTEVLSAMNKLLNILAEEVRELRSQVVESCTAKDNETLTCATEAGLADTTGGDDKPPLNTEHSLPDGGDEAADGGNGAAEGDTAADADGGTTVPPDSSEVPASPIESQVDSSATTTVQPVTVEATTIATTTTTSESLPPVPSSCPPSFTLEADGCYIFIYDERNWRTWGDAHAYCQTYGGELASPYRLAPLQAYLDAHFTETFWVGARLWNRNKFFWFNKRRVDKKAWKEGQPSKNPNKKCVYLDKRSGYRAANFFCGEKHPFVCDYRDGGARKIES